LDWSSTYIQELIGAASPQDVGCGDCGVTVTIPGKAQVVTNQDLIFAGLPLAERVFLALDPGMSFEWRAGEGQQVRKGAELLRLSGKAAAVLTGERTALTFLGHLSGVLTMTHQFVEQAAGTRVRVRNTLETTPGLRALEQYAVTQGGGTSRRDGRVGAILLNTNHIALAGGVKGAVDRAHAFASSQMNLPTMTAYEAVGAAPAYGEANCLSIQIEVHSESAVREALSAGAEWVLLRDLTPGGARQCVTIAREIRPDCILEISGGITLENVRAYAETGADYLSPRAIGSGSRADLRLLVENHQ
jgi:nicotinate-nucleotide pyrophosphorylase (carboxylating)